METFQTNKVGKIKTRYIGKMNVYLFDPDKEGKGSEVRKIRNPDQHKLP